MKQIFFYICCVLIITACNQTDTKAGEDKADLKTSAENIPTTADSVNLTTMQWIDSTFQDLGKVNEGQMLEVTYRFKNTGDKPLIISNASATCGCTVADKPEEPFAPGQEGKITAKFDSKSRQGEQRKEVFVTANTKPSNNHSLSFRVEVVKRN